MRQSKACFHWLIVYPESCGECCGLPLLPGQSISVIEKPWASGCPKLQKTLLLTAFEVHGWRNVFFVGWPGNSVAGHSQPVKPLPNRSLHSWGAAGHKKAHWGLSKGEKMVLYFNQIILTMSLLPWSHDNRRLSTYLFQIRKKKKEKGIGI